MIRLLNNQDIPCVMQYLLENEIETILLYGNVSACGLENMPEIRRCADYYGYFSGEELKGVLAFYNLGSCIPHFTDSSAVDGFVELMSNRRFDVVLGMSRIISPVIEKLNEYKAYTKKDDEMYMVNRNFKPFSSDNAVCIDADSSEDVHAAFCARISGELFNEKRTLEEQRKVLLQRPPDEEYKLVAVNGHLAAQACVHCYTAKYGQVGAVGTLPEFRNRGYAKTAVSELCRCITGKGRIPTLMVRKNNGPAVNAYLKLGFERYDDYLMVWYV